jgi:hypothetical protein
MEFMTERALSVDAPRVEWLDRARGIHGRKHIASIGKLVEGGAEPQHSLGRMRIKYAAGTVAELGFERARRQRMVLVAAKGRLDDVLERLASGGRDPHSRIEVIVSRAPETGIRLRIHFGGERPRGAVAHRVI